VLGDALPLVAQSTLPVNGHVNPFLSAAGTRDLVASFFRLAAQLYEPSVTPSLTS
jgi:hypothetical protein